MPLFVPDKTKFKNFKDVKLSFLSESFAASCIFKNRLYLFKTGSSIGAQSYEVLDGETLETLSVNSAGVANFIVVYAKVFKNKIILLVDRGSANDKIKYTADGINWGSMNVDSSGYDLSVGAQRLIKVLMFNSGGNKLNIYEAADVAEPWVAISTNYEIPNFNLARFTSKFSVSYLPSINKHFFCLYSTAPKDNKVLLIDSNNLISFVSLNHPGGGYLSGITELNGKKYAFFTFKDYGINSPPKIVELNDNLEILKDISGEIFGDNSYITSFCTNSGILYAVANNGIIYYSEGGLFKVGGITGEAASGRTAVGDAFKGKVYLGIGAGVIQSTL